MSRLTYRESAPAGGRREHRKQVTRRDLIAAGRRLFGEKGLYESRIEDLTDSAGIAKGTLYGYFSCKEDLIEAVIREAFGDLLRQVQGRARQARTRRGLLAAVVRAHLDFFNRNPDLVLVFHQVRGLLKFRRRKWRPLQRVLVDYLGGLAGVLRNPAGRGPRPDPDELAPVLFGAISGVLSLHAVLADRARLAPPSESTVRSLVAMGLAHEGLKQGRNDLQGGDRLPRRRPWAGEIPC